MIIELHAYVCDGCARRSTDAGFTTLAAAWVHAERGGWERVDEPVDHAGHIPARHYCGPCSTHRRVCAKFMAGFSLQPLEGPRVHQ